MNILLIDDDVDDQEIFVEALKEIGNQIEYVLAANGREAIAHLISDKTKPDLIFLDLNMPLMDGRQFLRTYMTKEGKKIPVIILSTSSDTATKTELLQMGASHFVTKPHSFKEMKELLRTILL